MALRKEITAKILDLLRQNPQGLNITAIVQNININRNTAGRYLENLMVSGQVEMRRFGMAKIYRLAKRVPLSAMLSISSELIMLLDSSMRVIYANDQFLQFCGTTQKDLYGKNIEYTPCATAFDDAFDSLKKQIRAGISGKEWYGELTLQQKGVVFACRIAPAVFEEGQRGVSVMFDDITGRKQAERTIQESERQFRLLAEHSLDMIHRHTPDDICIYISPASKTILGYDPDELIGRPVFKVLHPDDAHNVPDYKSRLNRKNHTAKISYRVRHRDGHYVWLESVLRAIFDEKTGELVEIYGVTRDITRRNRAEQAQRESEERYRSLVEISPDPVILHQEGKIVYMNPAAFRLIGASPSDAVIGKNILDFIHPDFRNAVKKNIIKDLRGDSTPLMELTMVRIDGTPVIVEGRGVRTIINGKPAVQVAIKDITRRKQAEAALQESEQKYRDIFEKSVLGLFRTAPDGRVIDANDALARMYGYSGAAEMVAAVPDVGRYYANPEERKKMLHTLAKKGIVENYETLHLKRDGTRFWVSITVRTVRNTDGTVLFYEGSNIDITERKRAEAALRESEARFRSYFDMPLHGIAITSPEKGWLQVNDRICSILGYTRDEIIHMTWAEMTHPDDLAADVEQFNRIVSGEIEQYTLDKRFIRKDGRVIWISIAVGCVRKPDGTVDYIVGLMEDITERKRAEEALKERLKELNCLFGMSALLELPGISLDEILKRTVLLLPPAWQFPEITEACIVVEGQTFQTARFRETSWMLTREIMVHGKPAGQVEVCYLEERPASNEGPFLTDERYLLKAIAERLGRIIERKRMEEALKESEAKFRNLFENAVVGFFRSSHDGRLIGANPAYAKMYGYQDPDSIIREITNVGVQLYANPDDRNKILATLAAQGYLEPTEVQVRHRDGHLFWVSVTARTVRDAEGRILGYEGTFVDITERKRAEEALRESEEKYRTLVERANDGICVIQDGIVKICNSRIPEYWGGSIEEIVGRGFQEFIHPDAMPLVMDWYNRRMRGESPPRVYNTILRRKDGSRSFVEVNAGIILYDGRPADLLILRDINERKKAEDELRKSEATIRALIDTPVDSLLLVDPEGIILEGNTTFAKRLGMTVEELKGRCVYDLPPPDLAKSRKSRIENIVRTGEPDRYEDQRAGLWFDNSLHPILDADGNVIKIAIIARDITDRRQMEEELRTCINRFGT